MSHSLRSENGPWKSTSKTLGMRYVQRESSCEIGHDYTRLEMWALLRGATSVLPGTYAPAQPQVDAVLPLVLLASTLARPTRGRAVSNHTTSLEEVYIQTPQLVTQPCHCPISQSIYLRLYHSLAMYAHGNRNRSLFRCISLSVPLEPHNLPVTIVLVPRIAATLQSSNAPHVSALRPLVIAAFFPTVASHA